jgi:hypothetical protein
LRDIAGTVARHDCGPPSGYTEMAPDNISRGPELN